MFTPRDAWAAFDSLSGMERTTIYLTRAQKAALTRTARASGRSVSELIRAGVDLVTARDRIAEPRLPLFESGIPDLADRADELLEGFGRS